MQPRQHDAPARTSAPIWLCGGGTGGHVYPALAVAAALRGDASLAYIGSADGMEAALVARESDLPFHAVPAAALRGRGPLALARNLATLLRGVAAARALIRRERPAAILGTGGYVCAPVFLAAWLARVPTVIYLPDLVPGLAIRALERLATVLACSVPDSASFFRRRAAAGPADAAEAPPALLATGYPARPELYALDRAACRAALGLDPQLPALLVYGGSRGARSLNQAIGALLPDLLPEAQIVHVCGREGDEQFLRAAAERLPEQLRGRYRLFPYLHSEPGQPGASMSAALGAADIAVCRSGASTLGELPAVGLPAILVPYPYVHQDENADFLVRQGAALKIADRAMLGDGPPGSGPLSAALRRLIGDPAARAAMAARMRSLARPGAASDLAGVLLALAARRINA